MKVTKLSSGDYQATMKESELHIVQFLTMFFLNIPRVVFKGRMIRRVQRIHDALKEIS